MPVAVGVCAITGGGDVEYVLLLVMGGGNCRWLARLELDMLGCNNGLGRVEVVAVDAVAVEVLLLLAGCGAGDADDALSPAPCSSVSSSSSSSCRRADPLSSCSFSTQPCRYLTYSIPAWRMASLCISTPLQAGIMSLSTPNSSFIFDLRLRSMTECAVFRAILLPAADVVDCCFFFGEVGFAVDGTLGRSSFGFIWMIFLARLGGGGSSSLPLVLPDNVRFR